MKKTTASNQSAKSVFKCISCEKLEFLNKEHLGVINILNTDLAQARKEIANLKQMLESRQTRMAIYREALEKIVKMEGPFSMDHHQHAKNTIKFNQDIAKEALSKKVKE